MDEEAAKAEADRIEAALQKLSAEKDAKEAKAAEPRPEWERLKEARRREWALPLDERLLLLRMMGRDDEAAALEARADEPIDPDKPQRSKAPEPVEPHRSSGSVRQPAPHRQTPRWPLWLVLPRMELWQAVLLSVGIEPSEALKAEAVGRVPQAGLSFNRLPRDFFARRQDCILALSLDGPLRPQGPLYSGILQSPRCPVLLAEVAAFLARIGATVPNEMQAVPAVPNTEEPDQSDSEEMQPLQRWQAQDRAILGAIQALGLTAQALPRSAAGKPGAKMEIRRALKDNPLFVSDKVFDKAWERLRAAGDVGDASSPALG